MNRSESRYFATAAKMDEALLALLGKKDFEYITVKEICQAAGVNRSTFYLHYETIGDLVGECVGYLNQRFLTYIGPEQRKLVDRLKDCPLDELYLMTPEYCPIPRLHQGVRVPVPRSRQKRGGSSARHYV